MRLVQRAGDKKWEWAACVWIISQGTANMGRKALNYRQGRKSMKRIQEKACEVCLYLFWLLLTGSPKEQFFLFCSVAHKTKEHAKLEITLAHVPSLRASSPDLKNPREVTRERHAKEFKVDRLQIIFVAKKYISTCRNCSSVGCLKCVQFHNWFRLH